MDWFQVFRKQLPVLTLYLMISWQIFSRLSSDVSLFNPRSNMASSSLGCLNSTTFESLSFIPSYASRTIILYNSSRNWWWVSTIIWPFDTPWNKRRINLKGLCVYLHLRRENTCKCMQILLTSLLWKRTCISAYVEKCTSFDKWM